MPQPSSNRSSTAHRVHPVMGTVGSMHVYDDVAAELVEPALDEVVRELDRLEALFSTYRPDSEVSRINAGELALAAASEEVLDVFDACTWLEQVSAGAFDVRPDGPAGAVDPAGFVKGWATERAAAALTRHGLEHWYVSVGGDIVMHGEPAPGARWDVGIADPLHPGTLRATLHVEAGAVATSGTAERGLHLWDTRHGGTAHALASVTVAGPSLTWADAFATTVFVMGRSGLGWLERFEGYHAVAVCLDGELVCTSALAA